MLGIFVVIGVYVGISDEYDLKEGFELGKILGFKLVYLVV